MMTPLAHLTNEPHMAWSAALAVFALGLAIGTCLGLILARQVGRSAVRK